MTVPVDWSVKVKFVCPAVPVVAETEKAAAGALPVEPIVAVATLDAADSPAELHAVT